MSDGIYSGLLTIEVILHMSYNSDMDEVFFALCKTVDNPVSLGQWLRFKYSKSELLTSGINPRHYKDAASFKIDYACVNLLQKWKGLDTGVDLEAVAMQSFANSEAQCQETNRRFKNLATIPRGSAHGYLHAAQRKIAKLLGMFSVDKVSDSFGWGPGATYELPRRRAFIDTKLHELPISVSRTARALLRCTIEADLHWSAAILGQLPEGPFCLTADVFEEVNVCRVATVPKSAKTHRTIAVEPRGNGFLQKGFGAYIRDRLRTVGINLDDQTRNQHYARRAWLDGLATLDLKAASDTVSTELVWALLPWDWACSLDALRSKKAVMPDGAVVSLNKFSSMGNGFTFELESLIFWALCEAVRDQHDREGIVAVYGDDLIVPAAIATDVCLLLQFCGFTINDEKSFVEGVFHESCGAHYFAGVLVTPAYQKNDLDSLSEFIRFGNRLIRLSFRFGGNKYLAKVVRPAYVALRRRARARYLDSDDYCIPFGSEGDDGWSTRYAAFPFERRNLSQMGIKCTVIGQKMISLPADDRSLLAWSFRRGVVTQVPFEGSVSYASTTQVERRTRRVIPVGQFSVTWG